MGAWPNRPHEIAKRLAVLDILHESDEFAALSVTSVGRQEAMTGEIPAHRLLGWNYEGIALKVDGCAHSLFLNVKLAA
ncbi:hypothetical protein [Microvirga pudoricolor]|uniref:hypothetical protein n=1 Tax=Microvirga pudoricolor TaxID=2778729 RepID=UPI001E5CADCD|nr:hypothetical protein [Microvirga pudoricolor]MBM6596035.1 hypothetical protein [Microvirga pudoricolor]